MFLVTEIFPCERTSTTGPGPFCSNERIMNINGRTGTEYKAQLDFSMTSS